MDLLVLGSGSSVPHPKRSSSAYWVAAGGGTILLDCSASSIHRMAMEGCDWANLDAIWISHFHLDHCGGLAPLLFGTKYAPETQNRIKPMYIFGPPGIKGLVNGFDLVNDYGLLEQPFPLEVVEIEPGRSFEIFDGLKAKSFSTPHTAESSAVRIEETGGGSLVYTSDTGYSTNLGAFARAVDLLLIECSFVKDKPVEKHLEIRDVAQMARFSMAEKIMLTHFYPEWDNVVFSDEVDDISVFGEVIEAIDGLRLNVGQRPIT